ncbi:MAG: glycosyltransferase [Bacteroidales bacterium]|nr:glycosyltransferase [Bacteroidales bacterium]
MKLSIVIPLYNRPDEIDELLDSLEKQTSNNFDVIVVEDGSDKPSKDIIENHSNKLDIKYFFKQNTGPGLTRNYGAERSDGDYIVFFDSDCIIPPDYIKIVTESLEKEYVDAYGGPDAALPTFTPVQKAISYAMTSILSTGGIRGASEKAGKFHPRSFNMGFSRKVFEATSGFSNMRFGEDIDMTLRILEQGFTTKLIKDAFVYHKRRTDFKKFFKQIFNSGCARINLKLRHKGSLKLIHTFPSLFLLGNIFCILAAVVSALIFKNIAAPLICVSPLVLFALMVFVDSVRQNGFQVGLLSVIAVYVQLSAYGLGFLKAVWHGLIRKKGDTFGFVRNFYK